MSDELRSIAGAGGGGGCFRKGTQVQLAGGKTLAIEELKTGDSVLAFDEDGNIHNAKVTELHYHEDPQPILRVKFWRGEVFITPNHWVLNQYGNFAEIGSLSTHDALVDGMGHLRPIIEAELVGYEPVWNLTVEPHHTFIASGVRVHNGGHRERYPVVAGSGGGSKSKGDGGGTPRAAVEDPDTLQSRAMISVLDLLGEGQIGGLVSGAQSIFFNDTPLQRVDGAMNFNGVSWDARYGTQWQSPMGGGFSDVETPNVVSSLVTASTPISVSITNPNVDAVRLIVAVQSLYSQDKTNGDIHGSYVNFKFDVSINGGPYQDLTGELSISGKTRSRYERSYQVALPKWGYGGAAQRWSIRMTRTTPDPADQSVQNQIGFESCVEIVNSRLSYPNSAIVGVTIDSSQFNSIPSRAYLVDGLYIRVPTNYDPASRQYYGIWDGTFKVAVSNNPAWVLYDILTTARYGLGQFLPESRVDKAKLYQIGRYCDEMVPNGFGGWEPRFTINTVIQAQAEAYKVISDITSVFRGMAYWNGGMVGFTQDAPGDSQMVYSHANVIDGLFTYTGSARKDRHSVAHVAWNDPTQNYQRVIEYVENPDMIAKVGIRKVEVVAFGCTSRAQAHRVGLWILYTEQFESDVVSFSVGIDSALVLPGDLIRIQDASRAGKRLGGRLTAPGLTSVVLDSPVQLAGLDGTTISIRMPDGTFAERTLRGLPAGASEQTSVSWWEPLPAYPVDGAIWIISEPNLVPMQARVLGVGQGKEVGQYTITAVEHNKSKFAAIEYGLKLQDTPTSAINTKSVTTPKNFAVSEVPVIIAPGIMGLTLDVSWECDAAYYEIDWKRTGKYETNWKTEKTSSALLELDNVRAGRYHFSITAVNAFGVRSARLDASYITVGKTAAPGDVANFVVQKRTRDLLLTWDAVTDINLLGYEVRVGVSWDEGSIITTNFAGTMLTHDQDNAGTYFYHIRSINMGGEYSDNVTTFKLVLVAPSTPKRFDIIQSGSRVELTWESAENEEISYYEVREGSAWQSGKVLAEVKATSLSVPSGTIGIRKFWIKAVAAPGIYSVNAAWVDTTIAMPTDSNIVASFNEAALNWPHNSLNMTPVGYDLMMIDGVSRCEYIFPVDLLDTYRAANSIYGQVTSILDDTDTITWTTSGFDWLSTESLRHWAPGGEVDSVVAKYQISMKAGLRFDEFDGWMLSGSLTSIGGKAATTATNVTYQAGRNTQGLRLQGGVKVDWTNVSIQPVFKYSTWLIPKMIGDAAQISVLEFSGAGGYLRLGYDEPTQRFSLTDNQGNAVYAPLTIVPNDVIGVVIVQTADVRKLFVGKLGGLVGHGEAALTPIGTMTALKLYWS